jgi:hypothetical protein
MDEQRRASLLDDLAADAGRQRDEFLSDAGSAFARFIEANKERLADLGGLVLIDDEPDYLFVGDDGMFRSRTRYQDDDGQWVAESEEIDDPAELVELFNPADLYAAFVDAAEAESAGEDSTEPAADADEAELVAEADAEGDDADESDDGDVLDEDWTTPVPAPATKDEAARKLYDLALTFQERSQWREAQLLDDFGSASEQLAATLGDNKIVEDEDERIWFRASGAFEGEVVPEEDEDGEPVWRTLATADDFVQFYDPTDLFGDLAEAIAELYPGVAPELDEEAADGRIDD